MKEFGIVHVRHKCGCWSYFRKSEKTEVFYKQCSECEKQSGLEKFIESIET
jgi:hypothetical protein